MSYCRWLEGDVYMYETVDGVIECCSCSLAKKVPTIFTKGIKEGDFLYKIFGKKGPCKHCGGVGCDACMMHETAVLHSYEEALEHLYEHRRKGDIVPERAFEALKEDIKKGS